MVSTDDLRLLSLLQSSDAGVDVFSSFSLYLKPFSTLSTSRKNQDRATTVRTLAKQFLPFLSKSISLLPKRLFAVKSDKEARESALDLFRVYDLCLNCLDLVSALLACTPHTIHFQRLQMIHYLGDWDLYENMYTEAFKALEKLRGSNISSRNWCFDCTEATCSSCMIPEDLDLPRIAPERTEDLVQFAKEFFINLPSSTIICISLLGGDLNQLLQELMHIRSPVCAWVLISRLHPESQPVSTLLPVDSVLEDDSANLSSTEATQVKSLIEPWLCPWGATVVDEVAPAFKSILEENYISSSTPEENTEESRCLQRKKRKELDNHLGIFLRNLEASWLGPWRCLLLGDWSNYKLPDSVQKKLVNDLKSKCKMEVNEMLLKAILGGGTDNFRGEACVAQLSLRNGCYVGRGGYLYEEDSCKTPTAASNISESRLELALKLIHDAATKLGQQDEHENREPIILVLDPEVQMLPWENIPVLRKQEVYRMPSVGCISAEMKKRSVASFPLIDPLDSFYLLNPGGDFTATQVKFESWFRDQNFEGKAGSEPTTIELIEALRTHDLFLYLGHGNGEQYIEKREIAKLVNCSAAFLMGCSSGSLWEKGRYNLEGIPHSYLLGGSPAVVATLWEVTDLEIDRFGKALLEAWLQERADSSSGGGCSQCESLANELAVMNLKGSKTTKRSRKLSVRNKPAQSNVDGSGKVECNHKQRRKIASFIAGARDACKFQHLTGGATVCYGVPTGITRKKGIDARLPSSSC